LLLGIYLLAAGLVELRRNWGRAGIIRHMNANKVALVTRASRGIGRAIALSLAAHGHDVVINYAKNATAAQEVRRLAQASGARCLAVQGDVSRRADRARLISETFSAFGRIDLLVNNAGVAPEVRADLLEATEESFDHLININLKGPYFLTQTVLRNSVNT